MDAPRIRLLNEWRKSLTAITQECCELYWTSPGGNTLQNSSCTATYNPSGKLSKLDEPDIWDTVGEVRTNSKVMYSCEPFTWTNKVRRPTRTYIQLSANTGCGLEDLPETMDDRDGWRERVKEVCASSATWWWWWWWWWWYISVWLKVL